MALVVASTASSGFSRPSSWPVRNQRRHAAIAEFQSQVLELLADMSSRLLHMETSLSGLQVCLPLGLTNLCAPQVSKCNTSHVQKMNRMEERIASIETLLFKASFEDFKTIDEVIANAKPDTRQRETYDENFGLEKDVKRRMSMSYSSAALHCRLDLGASNDHSTGVASSSDQSDLVSTTCLELDSTNEFYGIATHDVATQTSLDESYIPFSTSNASTNDYVDVIREMFASVADSTTAVITPTTMTNAATVVKDDLVLTLRRHQRKFDYVKTIAQEADKLVKEGYTVDKVGRLLWTTGELDQLLQKEMSIK